MIDRETTRANIAAYWNTLSPTYDAAPDHQLRSADERAAWIALLDDLLPPSPARILDAGTGTGFLALLLAEVGHDVVGIDIAEGMLAVACGKAAGLSRPPLFQLGDAADPPVPPGSLDALVSRHLLWTLPDPPGALANWYRALRPGGRLLVIDGLWSIGAAPPDPDQSSASTDPAYERYYTPAVQAQLPLIGARSLDQVFAAIAQAGFIAPRSVAIEPLLRAERASGVASTHPGRFIVAATRPDGESA